MLQSTTVNRGSSSQSNGGQTVPSFRAKVGDFGLCRKLVPPVLQLHLKGDAFGTVTHTAPETLEEGTLTQVGAVVCSGGGRYRCSWRWHAETHPGLRCDLI